MGDAVPARRVEQRLVVAGLDEIAHVEHRRTRNRAFDRWVVLVRRAAHRQLIAQPRAEKDQRGGGRAQGQPARGQFVRGAPHHPQQQRQHRQGQRGRAPVLGEQLDGLVVVRRQDAVGKTEVEALAIGLVAELRQPQVRRQDRAQQHGRRPRPGAPPQQGAGQHQGDAQQIDARRERVAMQAGLDPDRGDAGNEKRHPGLQKAGHGNTEAGRRAWTRRAGGAVRHGGGGRPSCELSIGCIRPG
ncbi:Uncharacterised protein [Bordetella pertussis]|nr:Uncharacterised protein [Bordetella pertussis]